MECVIEWLSNNTNIMDFPNTNIKVGTYEFDGIKLLKQNVEKYDLNKLLLDLHKLIYNNLGFDINFEQKPIEEFYNINNIIFFISFRFIRIH